ncbi:acyl-CoA thioesterase [Chamaesiphon minutus]|uniref:Putative thioesterase n=1 Tax=Chamaesiphon minutus (strain ATCC 27169 / PCC 6605) TaxID=1173020 RepID=K9UG28_CHAP6|nr:thioesterase family protein [Chamaesiphon minutus]AFY94072.1 putative thioesterase [Chamaesiphon minutus PCC 6605]
MSQSEQRKPFEIELHLPVKTYDIDFAGIVSNIVYVRWLEDLRLEMLGSFFPLQDQVTNGFAPIVLQTTIDYKQSIQMHDRPIGKMWMESLASLRWVVGAEILLAGKVSAIAQQTGIFVNLETKKPIRIPDRLQQQYNESRSN